MIAKCTCINEYQDKMYGKGMRVHNLMHGGKADVTNGGLILEGRCTVCSTERRVN